MTKAIAPIFATLMVLGLLGAERIWYEPPRQEVENYQTRVRQAVDAFPYSYGPWLGTDWPLPTAAQQMLHPNATISRQFRNSDTNEVFTLMYIEVGDSRDILGHYPPICYPSLGWTLQEPTTIPMDWPAWDRQVHGMEYVFTQNNLTSAYTKTVDNFLFLADYATYRDMNALQSAAVNRRHWGMGAGQVQFVFDADFPAERRKQIVESFLTALAPVFDAMQTDDPHATEIKQPQNGTMLNHP